MHHEIKITLMLKNPGQHVQNAFFVRITIFLGPFETSDIVSVYDFFC